MRVTDLHRPGIDNLTRPNPDDPTGKSTMRRVPEVLDCWFESGSMPFAQVHYPFENAEWFENHYPGDFIVEYIGQVRGWFYTMHVLATALFDRPAFRNAIVHGIVLGDDGRKMSKSLRNYPDVYEMFDAYGSDAMRWTLMSSPVLRGGDMPVTETAIRDSVRQVLLPLWNVYYFFTLYANAEGYDGDGPHRLDRTCSTATCSPRPGSWSRRRTAQLDDVRHLRRLRVGAVVPRRADELVRAPVPGPVLGRRPRTRSTRSTRCWRRVSRVLAPLAPMVAEEIWRGLTGGRSVHLTDWPRAAALPGRPRAGDRDGRRPRRLLGRAVAAQGARAAGPAAAGDADRGDAGRRRRCGPFTDLIADEVNVKERRVHRRTSPQYCEQVLSLVPRVLGPRLGGAGAAGDQGGQGRRLVGRRRRR